jgi:hypothetical protein
MRQAICGRSRRGSWAPFPPTVGGPGGAGKTTKVKRGWRWPPLFRDLQSVAVGIWATKNPAGWPGHRAVVEAGGLEPPTSTVRL